MSAADIMKSGQIFPPDAQTTPMNIAAGEKPVGGLNALFLLDKLAGLIFPQTKIKKPRKPEPKSKFQLEEEILERYNNRFFKDYFNIPSEKVNLFVAFVIEQGLPQEFLENGKELHLIGFFEKCNEEFKTQNQ